MNSKKQFSVFALMSLAFLLFVAGMAGDPNSDEALAVPLSKAPVDEDLNRPSHEELAAKPEPEESVVPEEITVVPSPNNPWAGYPNVCETFKVVQGNKRVKGKKGYHYPVNYKRNRYVRTRQDQARTRKLVELVAKEMGVKDPEFFVAFALHESTWNPEAIHILNPDREANQRAWERHSYSRTKELELETKMQNTSAQDKKYWHYKAELADVRLYKGNTHWNDRLLYDFVIPGRTVQVDGQETEIETKVLQESRNVWALGYGLYGMYAVGYVHIWDREAPPWILCADEGIIATIIQVWAARNAVSECDSLTKKNPEKWGHAGGTYEGVVRRLGRGHCGDQRLGKVWQQLMKQYDSVPWDQHADFGDKWPRYEMKKRRGEWVYKRDANGNKIPTDREALLAHMLKRAKEEGLLRDVPLQRKVPNSEPVIIPGHKPVTPERNSSAFGGGNPAAAP